MANMYRLLFRTVYTARRSSVSVCERTVFPAKCDKASVFRVANGGGVKALSTSSVRLCEKKDNVVPSTNADDMADQTESPPLSTQKAEDDGKVDNMATRVEKPVVLQRDDGGTIKQQMDVKIEQIIAKPKKVKTDGVKSGKESLLDLLGTMKVDVTNKRKLTNLKPQQNYYTTPKSEQAEVATVEASSKKSETLDPELVSAASAAASTLPNRSQAESALLMKLRQHEAIAEAQKKGNMNNLGEIIADMKVTKLNRRQNTGTYNQIQFDEDGRGYKQGAGGFQISFLREKRLDIFSPTTGEDEVDFAVARPTLWDMDYANWLSNSINLMPRNGLEEMIQWTKEGKMWQYPINNEIGLEEEASVPFHEHIFLDKHLKEGFPSQGPVRHFMELVVAGLSRNPYLTVQQKREHISWFRDYFQQKEDVLKEADVYLN
ncbi:28S ribosomal protein S31, mitochondrial [Scophthalmus maximus]|uniref:28S ribosomal protein S31, mitochondrial n=1 Tax=Scophthalmus maximus TaxID=52904 RepID=UPI001FA8F668|nr:28S ribosomal protein S31, mitochondrial [Scophthalmus maximus]